MLLQYQHRLGSNACVSLFLPSLFIASDIYSVIVARASSGINTKWQWWTPVVGMYAFPRKSYQHRQPFRIHT